MRKEKTPKMWYATLLLLVFAIGCGDSDRGSNPTLVAPALRSAVPLSGATGACTNTIVSATFSKTMNPATLNANTFTVTEPGGTAAAGQVTYNAASNTAIFTPSANLALNTLYTATVTTGAADVFGNHLGNAVVWTFTTGVTACSGVGAPRVISVTHPLGSVPTQLSPPLLARQ